jgi:glycosyltransferase involved in cell wall biosynthesis
MNLVYLADFDIPAKSASSIHVVKMCEAFGEHHDVTLIVPGKFDPGMINQIYDYYGVRANFRFHFLKLPRIPGRNWLYALKAFLHLLKINPHLVYGRSITGLLLAVFKWKSIIELHRPVHEYGILYGWAFRVIISHPNCLRVVVISRGLLDRQSKRYPSEKYIVAHDAANECQPQGAVHPDRFRQNCTYHAGYSGSIYRGRGIELIIQLAEKLPDVQFHLIGCGREDLRRQYDTVIPDNVICYGYIPPSEISGILCNMDILLAPYQPDTLTIGGTRQAGFMSPLKIFEYMSYQKPIVASDLPVLREVLDDTCALLVPPDDIDSWIHAVNLLKNDELSRNLAKRAYSKFRNHYTWSQRAKTVLDNLYVP